MTAFFSQDIKVYLENSTGLYWEIAVSAPPTFGQESQQAQANFSTLPTRDSASSLTIFEHKKLTKAEFAPANWAFSTFMRPASSVATGQSAEGILWQHFAGPASVTGNAAINFNPSLNSE